jgi:Ca-activated chloride channel family protein
VSARRVLLLAVALALLPAVAQAQGTDRKPAVGGGSYNDAPLLEPGSYRDTIQPGERVFYAFDVKAGQRLHVRAVLPGDGGLIPGADVFALGIETPLREVALAAAAEDLTGNGTFVTKTDTPIEYRTAPAPTFAASDDPVRFDEYRGPGTYFVSLDLQTSNPEPLPIEHEVELDVSVEGTPQPEPTPERTPAPATPTPAASQERGGEWAAGLVIAGLAGLLVGVVLAVVGRLARGRHRTA